MKLISPELFSGRINKSGGKITDLTSGLKFPDGNNGFFYFSLFIVPKNESTDIVYTLVDCKCMNNDSFVQTPFTLNCWEVPLLKEINVNGIDLNNFDVYYGFGK